jgi:hypothetical protein
MRLTDQNAKFLSNQASEHLCFVRFDCPCGCGVTTGAHFSPALDGQPFTHEGCLIWERVSGDTLETLTLSPSFLLYPDKSGCKGWHGYIRNGALEPC